MTVTAATERELAQLVPGGVRPGADSDAIDGTRPRWVVEPTTPDALAAVLAWASMHGQPVVLRGGGTHLDWGRRPGDLAVVVSTRALNRIIRYEPGDLTVSVEAGISIAALNRELARQGQWLPVDAATESSTIGGAVATNASGPLRHRYGTPRDQIIGVRLVTVDGRLAVAGGQVVKNVAGYDLSKLVAGSFGALAGIATATFKLAPIPAALTTLVLRFETSGDLATAAAAVSASQLDPLSLEAEAHLGADRTFRLLVRFGGTTRSNAEQAAAAGAIADQSGVTSSETLDGAREAAIWRDRAWRSRREPAAEIRASWMPANLPAVLALLTDAARGAAVEIDFTGRAGVGAGVIHIDGDPASAASVVTRLRDRPDTVGHVVITRAGRDVKDRIDVWGTAVPSAVIGRALKRALDPTGILNAGRGPI
jgi:glycolate oxidase FAD binding subunit